MNRYSLENVDKVSCRVDVVESTGLQTGLGDPDWNPATGQFEPNPYANYGKGDLSGTVTLLEVALNTAAIVALVAETGPGAGYALGRLGFTRVGGCIGSFSIELSSGTYGATALYHGSKNAPSVRQNGLQKSGGKANRGAFVTPQRAAAENAISRTARGQELAQKGARQNGI